MNTYDKKMDKETIKHIITQLFSEYKKEDIFNGIKNVNARLLWDINSFCSIYSRSNNKWFHGEIIKIIIEDEEWLVVKYNNGKNNGKNKKIQRFCFDIKPINLEYVHVNNNNLETIIKFIAKKLSGKTLINEQKLNNTENSVENDEIIFDVKRKYGDNRLSTLHVNVHVNTLRYSAPKLKFAMVTDLDNTLFPSNPNQTQSEYKLSNNYIHQFNDIWCNEYATKNCVLIYATGRNFQHYTSAVRRWDILKPDILVSKDGTQIHWFNKSLCHNCHLDLINNDIDSCHTTHTIDNSDNTHFVWEDSLWNAQLSQGWNQQFAEQLYDEVIDKYGDKLLKWPRNAAVQQLRVGVLCKGQELAREVRQYYMKKVGEYNATNMNMNRREFVAMKIHSFECLEGKMYQNEGYDPYWSAFTTESAGKGSAVEFLRKRLGLNKMDIICMGDSGNDISMLGMDGYNSVIMANSSKELMQFYEQNNGDNNTNMIKTTKPNTLGVIEGLRYFGPRLFKNAYQQQI